jgi:hypothetical protein
MIQYDEKIFHTAMVFEEIVKKYNLFPAPRLFGVYKKSDQVLLQSMPWDEDEIKKNIGISLISERYIMYIAR